MTARRISQRRKECSRKKCQESFAGNRPFGCFAQMTPDTFFSALAKTLQRTKGAPTCAKKSDVDRPPGSVPVGTKPSWTER